MAENKLEIVVGAAVLLIAGIFFYLLLLENDTFLENGGYELVAEFNSAQGVSVGTDVKLAGIAVGSVTGMAINPATYKADVKLIISSDLDIPVDSFLAVSSEGLLGGNFIEILPGIDFEYFQPGEKVVQTQSSVDLMSVMAGFANSQN
ncbi:MAG: outer membrane lipid asymmetry maintenance protein MlaD [Rhodobacteraceae bacterium]|nr:outer membrane lipid asymmetry maintenance protein MlaD [Paracoccaceae bacterium]MCY4249451.1 outer membrane lipid asymmetry maintenance protein MlaD [Paracoccaceae bacterium]MCY4307893.1 outer membrane lipid asymmetry maintenance protein MlaD [Paracoccaceae bacterium]